MRDFDARTVRSFTRGDANFTMADTCMMPWPGHSHLSFFLSLYTARPSFEYYRQVYFVHSGLQDESLQVTISKLP